jgi:hypothetical protein
MANTAFRDPGVELVPRASVPSAEYAQYKAVRDKFKLDALGQLEPAIRASTVASLDSFPYPVKFRIHAERLSARAPPPQAYELRTGRARPSRAAGGQQRTKQRIQPQERA